MVADQSNVAKLHRLHTYLADAYSKQRQFAVARRRLEKAPVVQRQALLTGYPNVADVVHKQQPG